jgi:hypothetical protein
MRWLWLAHRKVWEVAFKIPNEGQRSWQMGACMKLEGLKSGVPDVFIAFPSGKSPGLFIEFKAGKNKLTEKQKDMIEKLLAQGYCCYVCYSMDEAIKVTSEYLGVMDDNQRPTA